MLYILISLNCQICNSYNKDILSRKYRVKYIYTKKNLDKNLEKYIFLCYYLHYARYNIIFIMLYTLCNMAHTKIFLLYYQFHFIELFFIFFTCCPYINSCCFYTVMPKHISKFCYIFFNFIKSFRK